MAREDAIMARDRKEKENNRLVHQMRSKMDKMMNQREDQFAADMAQKKEVVAQVQANKEIVTEQVILNKAEKRAIRDEVNREIEEGLKQRRNKEAEELAKRRELVKQIHELEKVPIQRKRWFDPSEVNQQGLMEEMSLAELREKLETQKYQQA